MRLIDADALMKTLIHHSYHVKDYWNCTGAGMFLCGIEQAINEQPTVDAVPVIRCRYCEHYAGEGMYCAWNMIAKPDGFCHHANEEPVYADD